MFRIFYVTRYHEYELPSKGVKEESLWTPSAGDRKQIRQIAGASGQVISDALAQARLFLCGDCRQDTEG